MSEQPNIANAPKWLQRELDEQNDPKVTVSVAWLRGVFIKAGMEWPSDLPRGTVLHLSGMRDDE